MKFISLSLFLMLCFTACTPRVGAGIGGVVVSGDNIAASEIHADSKTGIHGTVMTTGTDMGL